jgi:hypothetical protein
MLFTSCGTSVINSEKEFLSYLDNPDNGYVKTREYENVGFKVKYLPNEFFLMNEMKYADSPLSETEQDSIINLYSQTRTFLLTIKAESNSGKDIMFYGITSEEAYRERFEKLNFGLGEYIHLKTDKNKYKPSLINLENVYGLSKNRNINIVFAPKTENDDLFTSATYDLVFEDFIFSSGINHFRFNRTDLDNKLKLDLHK